MKQPTKDTMREQLALAADEIIRLREENQILRNGKAQLWRRSFEWYVADRTPWWRRLFS